MKHFLNALVIIFATLLLFSCGEEENPDVVMKNDAFQVMMKESAQRDSAMLELVKTLNLIDDNIDKISERKNSLDLTSGDVENRQTYRERVLDEIQEIYEMMQQNKDKIAQLNMRLAATRNKLDESNADLKHANELIAQYQIMIDNMTRKMEMKDEEIYQLKESLSQMDISLDSLKQAYVEQKTEMNMVFFAFGSKKELMYHNIIDKTGGFIGIGKSVKIKPDFNKEYFTQANAEELESIDLYVKEAKILSTHSKTSYHFEGEEKVEKLIIDDKIAFWEASKYLVIEVTQ